jgi:uncharacterized membrane protein
MPQVAGIFDNPVVANQAIASLLSAGLTKDDLSLLMSNDAKKNFSSAGKDTGDRAIVDTAIGAGAGGVLGALVAGLTTVSAMLIPGAQLLVVGPVVSMLSGIGTGAALGGLAGVLSALGISAVESSHFEKEIKAGRAVVLVHTKDDQQTAVARSIRSAEGPNRIKAA